MADDDGLSLFQIDEARISLQLNSDAKLNTQENITVIAESTDPHTKESIKCQEDFTLYMLSAANQTIFPTKLPSTSTYSINYPG